MTMQASPTLPKDQPAPAASQGNGPQPQTGQRPAGALPPGVTLPGAAKPQGPKPVADSGVSALQRLLKVESDVRNADSISDLIFLTANETRKLVSARQIYIIRLGENGAPQVAGISSLAQVDRESPAVVWVERLVTRLAKEQDITKTQAFRLPAYCEDNDTYDNRTYPFPEFKWVPLKARNGHAFAGIILTRETPWGESDDVIVRRLSETIAHSWQALEQPHRFTIKKVVNVKTKMALAAAIAAAMLIPVPMTVLAPGEIAAVDAFVVAAAIDGVIENILVEPNSEVAAGTPIVRFSDTEPRNALVVAEREVQVAEARFRQVAQAAFKDPDAKRDLAVTRADLAVRQAERDYARDVLAKTVITSPRAGIAVYADKRELVGRPATVGQRILEIADPTKVEVKIDVPVSDASALEPGAHVRMFLDSDPLNPLSATLTRTSHTARAKDPTTLAFRVEAALTPVEGSTPPRLGLRGTAQIQGPRVTLFYFLFRKPISFVRQRIGL